MVIAGAVVIVSKETEAAQSVEVEVEVAPVSPSVLGCANSFPWDGSEASADHPLLKEVPNTRPCVKVMIR